MVEDTVNLQKKVSIKKVPIKKVSAKKSVFEQSISSKEKGWGQQACHQFKESKSVHPHHHFKMETLQSLRDIVK